MALFSPLASATSARAASTRLLMKEKADDETAQDNRDGVHGKRSRHLDLVHKDSVSLLDNAWVLLARCGK